MALSSVMTGWITGLSAETAEFVCHCSGLGRETPQSYIDGDGSVFGWTWNVAPLMKDMQQVLIREQPELATTFERLMTSKEFRRLAELRDAGDSPRIQKERDNAADDFNKILIDEFGTVIYVSARPPTGEDSLSRFLRVTYTPTKKVGLVRPPDCTVVSC